MFTTGTAVGVVPVGGLFYRFWSSYYCFCYHSCCFYLSYYFCYFYSPNCSCFPRGEWHSVPCYTMGGVAASLGAHLEGVMRGRMARCALLPLLLCTYCFVFCSCSYTYCYATPASVQPLGCRAGDLEAGGLAGSLLLWVTWPCLSN